jgi:acetyl esterase/lipase
MRITRLVVILAIGLAAALAWAGAAGQRLRPRDVDAIPSRPADTRVPYGADPLQFGELRLPAGQGPFPVAIVVHGGCWVSRFATLQNTAALADALRDAGVATWNVEYRRLDNPGGGWPGTFADVAAAADHVRVLGAGHPLDLSRVIAVGHSAGGHLALWLAARERLPRTSELHRAEPLRLVGAASLGGPGDLRDFTTYAHSICGAPVIEQLLGGTPDAVPARFAQASPAELLPIGARQLLIVGAEDPVMPARAREAYAAAAARAGTPAEIVVVPDAGHFEVIAPTSAAWTTVRARLLDLTRAGRAPARTP